MHEDKHCRPIIFTSDGLSAGVQEAFPAGPSSSRGNRAPRISGTGGTGGWLPPQPIPGRSSEGGSEWGAAGGSLSVPGRPHQMGSMTNLADAGAEPLGSPIEGYLSTSY